MHLFIAAYHQQRETVLRASVACSRHSIVSPLGLWQGAVRNERVEWQWMCCQAPCIPAVPVHAIALPKVGRRAIKFRGPSIKDLRI